jgi:hypothetical protein
MTKMARDIFAKFVIQWREQTWTQLGRFCFALELPIQQEEVQNHTEEQIGSVE